LPTQYELILACTNLCKKQLKRGRVFQVLSAGCDRLSKRNETKFKFIAIEEEEECRLLYSSNVGIKECV
jgi:hypothetical protein